jgi:hypothetical protein
MLHRQNSRSSLAKFLLLLGVFADYCQRDLVDESEMIRIQMGMHNRSEMVAVYGIPCVIPHHNTNSNGNTYINQQ